MSNASEYVGISNALFNAANNRVQGGCVRCWWFCTNDVIEQSAYWTRTRTRLLTNDIMVTSSSCSDDSATSTIVVAECDWT